MFSWAWLLIGLWAGGTIGFVGSNLLRKSRGALENGNSNLPVAGYPDFSDADLNIVEACGDLERLARSRGQLQVAYLLNMAKLASEPTVAASSWPDTQK